VVGVTGSIPARLEQVDRSAAALPYVEPRHRRPRGPDHRPGLRVVVSLGAFRQLAFLLAVGVLIDSFVVRSLLVPALVALFGRTHMEEMSEALGAAAPDAVTEPRREGRRARSTGNSRTRCPARRFSGFWHHRRFGRHAVNGRCLDNQSKSRNRPRLTQEARLLGSR
jgi:hypothetical protein